VTLLAGRRKFACHVIGIRRLLIILRMAAVTLSRKTLELPGSSAFVTRFAIDCGMCTDQRETILVLLNLLQRNTPSFDRMATLAVGSKLPPMNVSVAVGALCSNV